MPQLRDSSALSNLHSLRQACERANDEALARLSRELQDSERSVLTALTRRGKERSEIPAQTREREEVEARPAPAAPPSRDGGGGGGADRAPGPAAARSFWRQLERATMARAAARGAPAASPGGSSPAPSGSKDAGGSEGVPEWLRGPCLAAALGCADLGCRGATPASAPAVREPEPWRIAECWKGRLAEARHRWGDSLSKSKDQLEADLARELEASVLGLRAAGLLIPQKKGTLAKGVPSLESLVLLLLEALPGCLPRVAVACGSASCHASRSPAATRRAALGGA